MSEGLNDGIMVEVFVNQLEKVRRQQVIMFPAEFKDQMLVASGIMIQRFSNVGITVFENVTNDVGDGVKMMAVRTDDVECSCFAIDRDLLHLSDHEAGEKVEQDDLLLDLMAKRLADSIVDDLEKEQHEKDFMGVFSKN